MVGDELEMSVEERDQRAAEQKRLRNTPCSDCGKPVDCRRNGQENPVCRDCRRVRNLPKPRGSRPPLQPCGTHAAYKRHLKAGEKACTVCLQAEADRSYRQFHPEWDGCPETRDRAYNPNTGAGSQKFSCEQCGRRFERYVAPRETRLPRFCSQKCGNDFRNVGGRKAANRARRATAASTNDGIIDMQIWDRDDWLCRIPGCELGPIRADLRKPESLSPSVDHIVPLSLGGADTAPNKRSAHLFCNLSRNNRMCPDDVAMITVELAPLGLLLRPERAKVVYLCMVCQAAPARREGATCWDCYQGARVAARDAMQVQAMALREQGMPWRQIAETLGLSGPGAAHNVAYPPWDKYDRP